MYVRLSQVQYDVKNMSIQRYWDKEQQSYAQSEQCKTPSDGAQCTRKWNFVQKIEIKIVTKQQKTGKHVENQKFYLVSH